MTIRFKIIGAMGLLLIVVLVQLLFVYRHTTLARRDLQQFELFSLRQVTVADNLLDLAASLESVLTEGRSAPAEKTDALLDSLASTIRESVDATSRGVATAQEPNNQSMLAREAEELLLLRTMSQQVAGFQSRFRELTDIGARDMLSAQLLLALRQDLTPAVRRYRDQSVAGLLEQNHRLQARSDQAMKLLLGSAVVALLITLAAGYWLARNVTQPLRAMGHTLEEIAGGNDNSRLPDAGRDEFSQLSRGFNRLLDNLTASIRSRDELSQLAELRAREIDDFFNLSLDVLCIANDQGKFVRVNPAFAALLGYTREELLAQPYYDLIHPDDRDATHAQGGKLWQGDSVFNFENRYRCRDGTWRWFSWHVRPSRQSGLLYAVARDVTERKALELESKENREALRQLNKHLEEMVASRTMKLRESRERFRVMMESIKDYAIILLDEEGIVTNWNRGAERIHGCRAEDVLGRHFSTFYSTADITSGRPHRALAVAREQDRFEEESWIERRDGKRILTHVVITAVRDEPAGLRGFAMITHDITERHKAAEELHRRDELLASLMENLAEAVIACDASGKLTFFNQTAREWYGPDAIHLHQEQWAKGFDIYAEDGVTSLDARNAPLARTLAGERVRDTAIVFVHPNLPPRHVLCSGDPLFDSAGQKLGAVLVMHDITERQHIERMHGRTQRLESIGTLAGGIAHDLNNALSPVLLGLGILRARHGAASALLDTIEASARRGASMVRQLLTFAKGVDGERVALNLRKLVAEMESIVTRTFPKNIEFKVQVPAQISPVLGDSTQIHQVLLNLCVNARDAMPEGGCLTLTVENQPIDAIAASRLPELKPGPYVLIRVNDTGTGIPPDIIERIFEPFFSTKPPEQGTGLGLSTVLGIVRSHGGSLQVSSTPKVGTTFSVYLPVADSPASTSAAPMIHKPISGDGRKILLVDDEGNIRQITRAVLESLDFQVIIADNGEKALDLLKDNLNGMALIITDLSMPKMDGLSFIACVRNILPEVPIIMCSGRVENFHMEQLHRMGVRTVLQKPFSQREIEDALVSVFGRTSGSARPADGRG